MFDLTGKVALVTGGSRGIGRAAALALAKQGAQGRDQLREQRRRSSRGRRGHREGRRQSRDCAVRRRQRRRRRESHRRGRQAPGRLDILVCSAGISIDGLLLRLKDEDIDRIFAVNVKGSLACARAATKVMMRAKTGRIIFLSSVVGEMGNAGQTAYAASKSALLGITKSMARELSSRFITVNAITPGFIDTDMTGRAHRGPEDRHQLRHPARPHRQAGGDRRRRRVPGIGRSRLHHRPSPARERRHVYVILRFFDDTGRPVRRRHKP